MWSLGCSAGQRIPFPLVLFELIAKHPPFHGSSIGGLFHSIIYTPVRMVYCCSIDAASSLLLPFSLCAHRSEFAPCTAELGKCLLERPGSASLRQRAEGHAASTLPSRFASSVHSRLGEEVLCRCTLSSQSGAVVIGQRVRVLGKELCEWHGQLAMSQVHSLALSSPAW